jgi:curved DNA-binding protein CbpA
MKDYYSILGVLPSIDDVTLTAVYRALVRKYHPDVFTGSKEEAEKRTKEINGAYEVLGNSDKRYDNARKDNGFGNYRQEGATSSPSEATGDWEAQKKPKSNELRTQLTKLSRSLAFALQVAVSRVRHLSVIIGKAIISVFVLVHPFLTFCLSYRCMPCDVLYRGLGSPDVMPGHLEISGRPES